MSSAKDPNPTETLATLTARSAALAAEPPAGQPALVLEGEAQPVGAVAAKLQGFAAVYQASIDAERVYRAALAAREAIAPDALRLLGQTGAALKAMLGPQNPALGRYAVVPTKARRPLTTEQLAARKAKALATRRARGTRGKRQKLAITGAPGAPTTP